MNQPPDPLNELDRLFSGAWIAHEVIFDLHSELATMSAANDLTRALLAESARYTLELLPELMRDARRLAALWDEQSVLDPTAAAHTLDELRAELERTRPELDARRARQRDIAAELRERAGRASAP